MNEYKIIAKITYMVEINVVATNEDEANEIASEAIPHPTDSDKELANKISDIDLNLRSIYDFEIIDNINQGDATDTINFR